MNRIAKFEKVSYEQFKKDCLDTFPVWKEEVHIDYVNKLIQDIYNNIKLPKRATSGSAGYDFYIPYSLEIGVDENIKIPTGIRCKIEDGWVLKAYPRSGHGFKYGVHLSNTVGIIDADFYDSDNEGHIFIKLINDSKIAKPIKLNKGDAFCQGIFVPFGITIDDDVTEIRNGGFGSTDKH